MRTARVSEAIWQHGELPGEIDKAGAVVIVNACRCAAMWSRLANSTRLTPATFKQFRYAGRGSKRGRVLYGARFARLDPSHRSG